MVPIQTKKAWPLRVVVNVSLGLHLAAAAGYWWLSPKGFPLESSRFWMNSVLPIVLVVVAGIGLIGTHRNQWHVAAATVLCFASAWCAGAISGRVLFPSSLRGIWMIALVIAAAGFVCFLGLARGAPRYYRLWLFGSAASAIVGLFAIWTQIPLPPSTEPINAQPPQTALQNAPRPLVSTLRLGAGYEFDSAQTELALTAGNIRITCLPILDFVRISPDRFWSLFAPAKNEHRSPVAHSNDANVSTIRYSDDSIVSLSAPTAEGLLRLTAFTPVQQDTFSHLNTYCYFEIRGHKRLSLTFSPCPDAEIEVLPADYPAGRPARLAYLDDANRFSIVEAKSGEKGPFRPLASGKLARGEPLTIVVRDEGRPVASIKLEDWSSQVSTSLSPSAGWKLPVNAIEFQRLGDDAATAGALWITLAGTSVGRGWETVGHCAGIYRNGLVFQVAVPPEADGR
jgi:hypothetical protein